ncbi:MAG TPA: response regulator [Anaeromyxobacteraceae bacterium]|nr:response regulator [Anaeromyxobacteraceae bacterium]
MTAGAPPLVLVVDDDPDILEAICEILAMEGYRVAQARHGAEALARVAAERPDLILLDLMMPVMDGVAFAEALRTRHPGGHIPVLVISADANPERAAGGLQARAFLAKPFDLETLLAQVAAATGGPRPRESAASPQA